MILNCGKRLSSNENCDTFEKKQQLQIESGKLTVGSAGAIILAKVEFCVEQFGNGLPP